MIISLILFAIYSYYSTFLNLQYDESLSYTMSKDEYAEYTLLTFGALFPSSYYENEIETHTAELNMDFQRSKEYEAESQFNLWTYKQLYKEAKNRGL